MSFPSSARLLNELDHVRIRKLLPQQGVPGPLAELLAEADLVPPREVPPDVATMHSQLLLQDLDSGQQRRLTLCYPADADPAQGLISVLSPAGTSLLGLPVGTEAHWQTPDGRQHAVRLLDILFQPEASGHYTL
jgi:regulator of nucleoside diphosphate kinase